MKTDPQHFETVIIGSGFSGLLAAIQLQKNQCHDFVLLERNADLGGKGSYVSGLWPGWPQP